MLTRPLGATDLQVSILGFGGAPLGNMYKPVSDKEARDTLAAALNSGLNFFDTAPHYGAGLSERRIGDAVRGAHAENCVVSTKVGRLLYPDSNADVEAPRHGFVTPMPFEQRYDYSYDGIMRSWEESLIRLGLPSEIWNPTEGICEKMWISVLKEAFFNIRTNISREFFFVSNVSISAN